MLVSCMFQCLTARVYLGVCEEAGVESSWDRVLQFCESVFLALPGPLALHFLGTGNDATRAIPRGCLGGGPGTCRAGACGQRRQAIHLLHFPAPCAWLLAVPRSARVILPFITHPLCPLGVRECDPAGATFADRRPYRTQKPLLRNIIHSFLRICFLS